MVRSTAMKIGDVLTASFGFLYRNPSELVRAARGLIGRRLSVPLVGLRWLAEHAIPRNIFPFGLRIDVAPPFLRFGAEVNAMGTPIKAGISLGITRIQIAADAITVSVRLADIELELAGHSVSPLAVLIKSGVLDLSRPGDLVHHMPLRPELIVDAKGDQIVLDLLKIPVVSSNPAARITASLMSSMIRIESITADEEYLHVAFGSPESDGADA